MVCDEWQVPFKETRFQPAGPAPQEVKGKKRDGVLMLANYLPAFDTAISGIEQQMPLL